MEDQAEAETRMVQEDAELEVRMDADARATVHALIQPDHKIIAMSDFYSAWCSG